MAYIQANEYSPISRRHASNLKEAVGQIPEASSLGFDTLSHFLRIPMEYLHDTVGIPWLWVIPLTAAAIRAVLYVPITRPTRTALQRRLAISPLINAHKPFYLKKARERAKLDPSLGMSAHYSKMMKKLTGEETKRFACGISSTFFRPMLQFPVFLAMSWNIRDMLGIPGGTLKSLLQTMLGIEQAEGIEAAKQAALAFEPTMMEEGLPWAVDLTAADPTGTLSYGVAVIMLLQTLLGTQAQAGRASMLTKILLVLSASIGPLMVHAPAGILYYWACSSGLALVTNVYLDWRYPLVRFAPCKRPLLNNGLTPR
jgi:membrane protein insertase Oxa1/YidC/SpoIIIJ